MPDKTIHANHVEARNAAPRRRNSAFRRCSNTYAKCKEGLQRTLDMHQIIHNFVRCHWTTGEVPAVASGVITGALGADGIALSNSALQAIGCVAARMCNTNNCPSGIATQKPELRKTLDVDEASNRLKRFFTSSAALMKVMARACGHDHLNQFIPYDIATWNKQMAELAGIAFSG